MARNGAETGQRPVSGKQGNAAGSLIQRWQHVGLRARGARLYRVGVQSCGANEVCFKSLRNLGRALSKAVQCSEGNRQDSGREGRRPERCCCANTAAARQNGGGCNKAFAAGMRRRKIARATRGVRGTAPFLTFAGAPPRASRAPIKSNAPAPGGERRKGDYCGGRPAAASGTPGRGWATGPRPGRHD